MKIKCSKSGVKWIFNREISDKRIEFVKGAATVSDDVGKRLLAIYPDLAEVKSKATEQED